MGACLQAKGYWSGVEKPSFASKLPPPCSLQEPECNGGNSRRVSAARRPKGGGYFDDLSSPERPDRSGTRSFFNGTRSLTIRTAVLESLPRLGPDRGRMTAPTTPGKFLESLPRLGSDRLQASSHSGFVEMMELGNFLGFSFPIKRSF